MRGFLKWENAMSCEVKTTSSTRAHGKEHRRRNREPYYAGGINLAGERDAGNLEWPNRWTTQERQFIPARESPISILGRREARFDKKKKSVAQCSDRPLNRTCTSTNEKNVQPTGRQSLPKGTLGGKVNGTVRGDKGRGFV